MTVNMTTRPNYVVSAFLPEDLFVGPPAGPLRRRRTVAPGVPRRKPAERFAAPATPLRPHR